eukprot:3033794-Prymnesium_polylepis.1
MPPRACLCVRAVREFAGAGTSSGAGGARGSVLIYLHYEGCYVFRKSTKPAEPAESLCPVASWGRTPPRTDTPAARA